MNFSGAPSQSYDDYPVFTFDTQQTVKFKIDNIVKKYDLGGVWFWTLGSDSLESSSAAKYSLFHAAYQALNGGTPTPTQIPEYVEEASYSAGDKVSISNIIYECNKPWPYGGWCSQASFRPDGMYGSNAWTKIGTVPTPTPTPTIPDYSTGTRYSKGNQVMVGNRAYQCKSNSLCKRSFFRPGSQFGGFAWKRI
ncbi:hypothetical protein CDV26_11150 [Francisella halioticida]|uniref:GH18 domain-containing protein n=1 Tax=Francisella halioticida TaxID=549298 RepID=A0ABN5B2K3_9GAMM|nr:hypothetical protein [Francisella halioticida]ASG68862.1 hypothetical protein CDV26_11150 [Francisella halioticida]